jgi:RimJ/RimL family protein N-acetyltransferase
MKKLKKKNFYENFITGDLINLCIPNEKAIIKDGWAEWFNDIKNLSATKHGIFPNNRAKQFSILNSLANDKSKIVLMICDKSSSNAIGVISLQNIDFQQKSAEIAVNISKMNNQIISPFGTLEAMALITEHGFEVAGLHRIYGGQAYPQLSSWNKMIEIIGFKSEGITRKSFVRGMKIQDKVHFACHYDFYLKLKNIRGSLWGSTKIIKSIMKKQPKISFAKKIDKKVSEEEKKHFSFLFR